MTKKHYKSKGAHLLGNEYALQFYVRMAEELELLKQIEAEEEVQ